MSSGSGTRMVYGEVEAAAQKLHKEGLIIENEVTEFVNKLAKIPWSSAGREALDRTREKITSELAGFHTTVVAAGKLVEEAKTSLKTADNKVADNMSSFG